MTTYFVTGATGFIGRHLVERLLEREGDIHVLVREGSRAKLDELIEKWGQPDRIKPAPLGQVDVQLVFQRRDLVLEFFLDIRHRTRTTPNATTVTL